jgi:hypothetical protein
MNEKKPPARLVGVHHETFNDGINVGEATPPDENQQAPPRGVGFRKAGDLIRDQKALVYLLEGILEQGCTYAVVGPPKHGKSVVAMDIACNIALAREWCGKRTHGAAVFILAGEGHAGISRRLRAWCEYHGTSLDDAPLFISERAAALLSDLDAAGVAAEIRQMCENTGTAPGLIVIDTLARNFGHGDENSTEDMTRFVAVLDRYLGPLGATVLIVHHTPLASRDRPRGSSALLGAVDGVFLVAKDDDAGTVTRFRAGDQKDIASGGNELAFQLKGQELPGMADNFGNPVTAVVAEQTDAPPASVSAQPNGKNQRIAMKLLREMYAEGNTVAVSLAEWGERFKDIVKGENPRSAWQAVKNAAANCGGTWCVLDGAHVYPPEVYRATTRQDGGGGGNLNFDAR